MQLSRVVFQGYSESMHTFSIFSFEIIPYNYTIAFILHDFFCMYYIILFSQEIGTYFIGLRFWTLDDEVIWDRSHYRNLNSPLHPNPRTKLHFPREAVLHFPYPVIVFPGQNNFLSNFVYCRCCTITVSSALYLFWMSLLDMFYVFLAIL